MQNKRQIGAGYERIAAQWLCSRGMIILEHNYRCRQGEIDLIAVDGRYLVFIEVKYRKRGHTGHPAEAVDLRKQKRIVRAARCYLYEHKLPDTRPCRFDVVSILGGKMEHIKNAFER